MTLRFAIFLLASATLIGWAEAEEQPKKFQVIESLERNKPLYEYLTQGCKQWEGNCDHEWNKTGTCEQQAVICKEGYYLCNHEPQDPPGQTFCCNETDRPFTCEEETTTTQRTTTTTRTTRHTNRTTHTTTTHPTPPPKLICKANEHYHEHPRCMETSCDAVNNGQLRAGSDDPQECMNGTIPLKPACQCKADFARNKAGICVPWQKCGKDPECGEHTHFEVCPQCKDLQCSDIKAFNPDVPLPTSASPPAKHRYCLESGCRCDEGYARDEDDRCAEIVHAGPNACDFFKS